MPLFHLTKQEIHQRFIYADIESDQTGQDYWITQARTEVRRLISKRVTNKHHNSPSFHCITCPLA